MSPKREGDFPPHPATAQPFQGQRALPFSPRSPENIRRATYCGPVAVGGNLNLAEEL